LQSWLQTARDSSDSNGWLVHYRGEKVASVRGAWRRMLDDLELPREREWMPYLLRRSLATELRGRGVDPWDLAGFSSWVIEW
jgi:hypothetical protein